MIIETLENILSKDFNGNVLNELKSINSWRISPDESIYDDIKLSNNYSDSGMILHSYNTEYNIPRDDRDSLKHSFLNVSASHIFNSVLNNSEFAFNNIKVHRYLWNYYNRASDGVSHVDSKSDNTYSIIYYLHDNDGGTFIGDTFYKSISNNAIIFKSNINHRGCGPKNDKNRFLLNILFTADSYDRK
jgi:hypothetical protein